MRFASLLAASLLISGCGLLFHPDDSPLSAAASRGDLDEMRRLMDAGAGPNGELHAACPIIAAARSGQPDAIRLLAARGADPNRRGGVNGWTPLLHAIHKNRKVSVIALLGAGADVNRRGSGGATPLTMAAGYGYADIVEVLLEYGADPHLADAHGNNALTHAINGVGDIDRFTLGACQPETVRVLLSKAPDLRAKSA